MKSVYVIIDAASYINLSAVEYRFGTLLNLLAEEVVLKYSLTVNREISSHWNNRIPNVLERSAKIHQLGKYDQKEYEKRLFDEISQTVKNRGEKENFAVALDLFFMEKKKNLIFLTDDDNALGGCLKEVKNAFPLIKFWTSFDAVLYLYFSGKKNFPFEMAERAVQELYKQTLPCNSSKTDKNKMKEKYDTRIRYLSYLKRIRKVHEGVYS